MADMLKRQERDGGRTRHWRFNFKRLQRDLLQIEEDEQTLDSVFPQVRKHPQQPTGSQPLHKSKAQALSTTAQPKCSPADMLRC